MRSVDSWLDRFARKHPRLGVPRLMLYVVIGSLLVFFFDIFSSGTFSAMLCFSRYDILRGQLWRLITFVFVPNVSPQYILSFALSMYFCYFIGTMLEQEWGCTKFTLFYLMGVLLNIVVGFFTGYATMHYVNLSILFAFATLFPDMQFLLFFILPIKVKWLAWFDLALFLLDIAEMLLLGAYLAIPLPILAILNYILFFWSDLRRFFVRNRERARRKHSQAAVNFRAAQKKAKETKGYLHKCSVCGKTDADDPNMEFRYCSKCDGYYCYCMDHINTHVHVKED